MSVFKYKREDSFFEGDLKYKISPLKDRVDELLEPNGPWDVAEDYLAYQMFLYNETRAALKVNHLREFQDILEKIRVFFFSDLEVDINDVIKIYINRDSRPVARATSPSIRKTGKRIDLITEKPFYIILSQHFMNELEPDEQLAVIAHEVGHYYYHHNDVPYRSILDRFQFCEDSSIADKVFIQNLMKWGICREISADLCSLQITQSYESSALALIKFTTGIMDGADQVLIGLESYFSKLKNKYQSEVLKEHPVMLLRVLILKRVFEYCMKNGWERMDSDSIKGIIDDQVLLIYPEIIYDNNQNISLILRLGLLVGLADGEIDDDEKNYLKELLGSQDIGLADVIERKAKEYESELKKQRDSDTSSQLLEEEYAWQIIEKDMPAIIEYAQTSSDGFHFSSIIRKLLTLAAKDHEIHFYELRCIYLFAKEFGYSKQDIVQQMFNLDLE